MKIRKILVVESIDSLRFLLVRLLKELGYSSYESTDYISAKYILLTKDIDMVFASWNVPPDNGKLLLREMREQQKKIPVIMVAPVSQEQQLIRAIAKGASGYILKPFSLEAIKRAIIETIALDKVL